MKVTHRPTYSMGICGPFFLASCRWSGLPPFSCNVTLIGSTCCVPLGLCAKPPSLPKKSLSPLTCWATPPSHGRRHLQGYSVGCSDTLFSIDAPLSAGHCICSLPAAGGHQLLVQGDLSGLFHFRQDLNLLWPNKWTPCAL